MAFLDRVFVHALNTVKRIPRTGSARPPPAARLKLYGLYKQSMEGDVEGVMRRPEGNGLDEDAEREKWYDSVSCSFAVRLPPDRIARFKTGTLTLSHCDDRDAWSSNHSLSRTEAKRHYISTLIETMHKYASTTTESRELVAELEFVWDQVKSNPASSSASSPGQRTGDSAHQGQQMRSAFGGTGPESSKRKETESGDLRVLRPVSDADEEQIEDGDEFEEARSGLTDDEDKEDRVPPAKEPRSRDLDIRNRKWRKRVEQAIIKMTAEVAALREQLEAKSMFAGRPRRKLWAWMVWITLATIKHVLIDTAVFLLLYVWFRRKDDQRLEIGLKLLARAAASKTQHIKLPRRMQPNPKG